MITVSRKAHFNAAHRLYRKDWSFEKNDEIFGKCNNPNFHGHNYELIVSVTGEIDKETGYVIDMKVLKDIIKREVEDAFDHKNLNLEVPEFADLNPTAENIAVVIYNKMKSKLDSKLDLEITLYETPRNFVTILGNKYFMLYPIKFAPILKEKIWGGQKLKTLLNKASDLPNIGESWEISDVEGDTSIVSNGSLIGKSLKDLLETI